MELRIRPLVSQLRPSPTSSTRRSPTSGRPPTVHLHWRCVTSRRLTVSSPSPPLQLILCADGQWSRQQILHEGPHAYMATQVLYRPACSLHHVAFQLIAVLRCLSDVLQGRVCHTSPEEIDTNPPASFPAPDRSQTYHSSRSFLSASSAGLLPV